MGIIESGENHGTYHGFAAVVEFCRWLVSGTNISLQLKPHVSKTTSHGQEML